MAFLCFKLVRVKALMSGNRRSEIYDNVEDLSAATSITLVSSVSSILWLLAARLICSLTGVPGGEAG